MPEINTTVEAVEFDLVAGRKIAEQAKLILSLNQEIQTLKSVCASLTEQNKKLVSGGNKNDGESGRS
jgi:hypothetical protein